MTSGPRVAKSVTKKVTSTTTYTFGHAELCKRLRLPETAKFTAVVVDEGTGAGVSVIKGITAEVTTER